MRVLMAGVRGSTSPSGPDFVRYGTATSCVGLAHEDDPPTLVLDGGTGLAQLSKMIGAAPFRGTILLGHLHWDHTHGLPFFPAALHPKSRVDVRLPAEGDPVELLARAMGPPHFPLRPDELRGTWSFDGLEPGDHLIEGFTVMARVVPHLDSRTLAFRVSDGSASIAYFSDHCPLVAGAGPDGLGAYHPAALELAADVDLLIHDAQFTAAELPERAFLGHSAAEYAVGLGAAAGAARVLLYHHDPSRTDDQIDAIVERLRGGPVPVEAARENQVIRL